MTKCGGSAPDLNFFGWTLSNIKQQRVGVGGSLSDRRCKVDINDGSQTVWLIAKKIYGGSASKHQRTMCCCSGGSLFGGIGNGHLVQWSSSRGEMRPLGVPIVLELPEDAVCQEGRAGGELLAR